MPTEAPYGAWKSPITAQDVCGSSLGFAGLCVDKATSSVYLLEARPPSGFNILTEPDSGVDVTPEGSNTRTGVHEYGGGAFAAFRDQCITSDMKSNGVYLRRRNASKAWSDPIKAVPDNPAYRYADFAFHPKEPLVVAVREDHTTDEPSKVLNTLVLIDLESHQVQELVAESDFYSNPRFSASGDQLLWKDWSLPNMPWESSHLHVAPFKPNFVGSAIVFLADDSGFNEPYSWTEKHGSRRMLAESPREDIGDMDWTFGNSDWTALDDDTVAIAIGSTIHIFSLSQHAFTKTLDLPYSALSSLQAKTSTQLAMIARSASKPAELVLYDIQTEKVTVLKKASHSELSSEYISKPTIISFPSSPDPGSKDTPTAYAVYYAPKNGDLQDTHGKPPVLVRTHGGPTSQASRSFALEVQFFTSRGFAFVDVDYGGSSGYGKKYRDRLQGNWGIVDVADSVACVEYLKKEGLASKAAIFGGSSGGYTTLAALVSRSEVFDAGCSLYGIAELTGLALDTHKFESGYLFGLIGGTPEEIPDVYRERSPLTHAANIKAPLLVLQGQDDKVVPIEQADAIVKAVKANGGEVEYHVFPGEGHGFRRLENQLTSLTSRLRFFRKAFGIEGSETSKL